jgi:hypothetical protein
MIELRYTAQGKMNAGPQRIESDVTWNVREEGWTFGFISTGSYVI